MTGFVGNFIVLGQASHVSGEVEMHHAGNESPDSFRLQGMSLMVHTERNAAAQYILWI